MEYRSPFFLFCSRHDLAVSFSEYKIHVSTMTTPLPINYGNYPLKDISAPHPHDVLCGRGGGTNNHIGNSHWRMLVAANKQLYITLPKRQKMLLSRSIVNAVRSQNPPGRFLQKDSKTNTWFDVGDQRAQEKTSQALREGAPDIRKKVAAQGDVESTDKSTASSDDEQAESAVSENNNNNNNKNDNAGNNKTTATAQSPPSPVPADPKQEETPKPTPPDSTPPEGAPVSNQSAMPHHSHNSAVPQGHFPMGMYPGGPMPHYFMPAMSQVGPQGMVLYAGPNLQPVQVFPTMVMNEHGMMVPGMSMIPTTMMPMTNYPYPMSVTGPVQGTTHLNPNAPSKFNDATTNHEVKKTPTFDEFVAAPPDSLDSGGLSFGSTIMPDAEVTKSQAVATSSAPTANTKNTNMAHHDAFKNSGDDEPLPPAIDSLEPIGISFGDVSMMSTGTNRLEAGGTSFGTMMSLATMLPDGGLEAIGTSFGSLSLDPMDREQLFQRLEVTGGGPWIPPMFDVEDRATGNLLECSDTESEDSVSNADLVAQKSEAWEKMQMSVAQTQLRHTQSKGDTVNSDELMPPPVSGYRSNGLSIKEGTVLSVPTTAMQRDFSQMSAWNDDGDDDEVAFPPPQLEKQESGDGVLVGYLSEQHA
jgi:hypothetical protein